MISPQMTNVMTYIAPFVISPMIQPMMNVFHKAGDFVDEFVTSFETNISFIISNITNMIDFKSFTKYNDNSTMIHGCKEFIQDNHHVMIHVALLFVVLMLIVYNIKTKASMNKKLDHHVKLHAFQLWKQGSDFGRRIQGYSKLVDDLVEEAVQLRKARDQMNVNVHVMNLQIEEGEQEYAKLVTKYENIHNLVSSLFDIKFELDGEAAEQTDDDDVHDQITDDVEDMNVSDVDEESYKAFEPALVRCAVTRC